jgi:hypothetical protein
VLDILGLYFVMTRLLGRTEMKIMVTAVGKHSVFHDTMYIAGGPIFVEGQSSRFLWFDYRGCA